MTTWTDPTLSNVILAKSVHLSEIRTALNAEVVRRGKTALSWGYAVQSVGNTINAANLADIKTQIDYVRNSYNALPAQPAFSWISTYGINELLTAAKVTELRINVNDLENDCVCNCNYCTCDCNYCTCDCNYACTCNCNYACTCNCNYCVCNCNYCTCNCNYCTCNCNYCTCNCNHACVCNCNYTPPPGCVDSSGC